MAALAVAAVAGVIGAASGGVVALKRRFNRKVAELNGLTVFDGYEGEKDADGLKREFRELAMDDLTLEAEIGEGAFGKVGRVR